MAFSMEHVLFLKALSYAISVVKGNYAQNGAATSCIKERSVSVTNNGLFWQIGMSHFSFKLEKVDTLCSSECACILSVG